MSNDDLDLEAEGIPAIEDAPPGLEDDYNQFEGMMPPRDHPVAAEEFGITAEEERLQEPLAERVLREEPDVMADTLDDDSVGRLVEPDQGVAGLDSERDAIASEAFGDTDALSAEEAAMHITDLP
ncbi:MAG TPA: DUF5709 domain-containing protein [Acidimicrobiales bacterium]|nr:DUF5709 domain-containing protein [Acidimicrobiales bacterium]